VIENNVLQVYTIPAKLDISTVTPVLSSKYVPAKLEIEKTPGYVDMQSRDITCDIDSSECWAEEGHKTNMMLLEDNAQQCIADAQEGTHQVAEIGQLMVHAGHGENVYKEVAKQNNTGEIPDTGIKFIPSQGPTITWNMNQLVMDGHPAQNTYDWTTAAWPDTQLERKGNVTINEIQQPELHIEYTGDNSTFHLLDQLA
jgi:hypothetical protein